MERFPSGKNTFVMQPGASSAPCEGICVLHRCVIVRDGSVIATGSNLTNETRNVSGTSLKTGVGAVRFIYQGVVLMKGPFYTWRHRVQILPM